MLIAVRVGKQKFDKPHPYNFYRQSKQNRSREQMGDVFERSWETVQKRAS